MGTNRTHRFALFTHSTYSTYKTYRAHNPYGLRTDFKIRTYIEETDRC